jgi:hypothetical protein
MCMGENNINCTDGRWISDYVYIYIYIYTHTHTHTHTYIYIYIHIYIQIKTTLLAFNFTPQYKSTRYFISHYPDMKLMGYGKALFGIYVGTGICEERFVSIC